LIYLSKVNAENPNTGDVYDTTKGQPTSGQYISNDGRRDIKLPGYTTVDLGFHYRFRTGKITNTVDLHIKNIFDRKYFSTVAKTPADSRGYYLSYRVNL